MPATQTYEPIQTYTLGSAQTTVTFNSIPSTYTDLILIVAGKDNTTTDSFTIVFNGDTGSNYSMTYMQGNGSSGSSGRSSNTTSIQDMLVVDTTAVASGIFHIMNYKNTSVYKTVIARGDTTDFAIRGSIGLWRSNSAINSIAVRPGSSSFASGAIFTLYGILAA
jgi:hypothetical protein